MNLKYILFGLFICWHYQNIRCRTESKTYMSTERPVVEWLNTRYFKNFTLISKRLSRQDPRHYVEVYVHSLVVLSNAIVPEFYFYQLLTNGYQPSFVELHYKFCDMMNFDPFFGRPMQNAIDGQAGACPYPPGKYHLKNMMLPYVPKGFPFTKGRIYCNVSFVEGGVSKVIARGHIDMEVKMFITRKTK